MTTRKMPIGGEENAKKRQRVEGVTSNAVDSEASAESNDVVSFDDLNNDCLVHILSYLPAEEMNTVAICSQDCREARSSGSLDQTRSGTIVFTENSSNRSINEAIVAGDWNTVFTGNRTCLKIVGVERLDIYHLFITTSLTGVACLDLSVPEGSDREVIGPCLYELIRICPNAVEIDLSYINMDLQRGNHCVWHRCSKAAAQVKWKGCKRVNIIGISTSPDTGLTELCLNDVVFETRCDTLEEAANMYGSIEDSAPSRSEYMLQSSPTIQRLSIKNASWLCQAMPDGSEEALPQELIIKMMRRHPNLRWLCSDLTEENVAMLKQERPEVTFVSE